MAASYLIQELQDLSIPDDLISEISAFNDWKKLAEERAEFIHEQSSVTNKLEKRIAKMKGPQKIKKEIPTLEKELKERKREL
ncbi:hypothetical protein KCU78_g763, partial [Aureobasidium melanogenum]